MRGVGGTGRWSRLDREGLSRIRRTNCMVCNDPIIQPRSGRPRVYCSERCRQKYKGIRYSILEEQIELLRARIDILEGGK